MTGTPDRPEVSGSAEPHSPSRPDRRVVPIVLAACVVVVGFWEVMAYRSSQAPEPFQLTAEAFASFVPSAEGWSVRRMVLPADDPTAPNLFALEVRHAPVSSSRPVGVRLVHGYNMPECMKLKKYTVELAGEDCSGGSAKRQTWRLTSDIGDRELWCTAMLRPGDMAMTDVDIRSMTFPRMAAGDDPNYEVRGLTLRSLRHPLRNFGRFMRRRWSDARCRLDVFLRLRKAPWASGDVLALVASTLGGPVKSGEEQAATRELVAAHEFVHRELVRWKAAQGRGGSVGSGR